MVQVAFLFLEQKLHLKIKELEKKDFLIQEINDENEKKSVIYQEERLKLRWAKIYKGMVMLIKKYPHLVEEDVLMNHNIKVFKDIRFKTALKMNGK